MFAFVTIILVNSLPIAASFPSTLHTYKICFNEITDTLAASILYPHKKSMSTMSKIIEILKSVGFEIEIKKFINIFEYYLSCRRLL